MVLKEINTVNFRPFGVLVGDIERYQRFPSDLCSDDTRVSSALWYYERDVVVEPLGGVGILFIRQPDDMLHKFLLDKAVRIRREMQFCVMPYDSRLDYRLYHTSPRIVTSTANILSGAGFTPTISVKTLYTVLYQEKSRQFDFRGERHSFWEFTYINKGNMLCEVEGVSYELKQGQMMFFAPNQFHAQRSDGRSPLTFLTITFDGEIAEQELLLNRGIYADERCQQAIQAIIDEERSSGVYSDDMILCDMNRLLITVIRNIRTDSTVTRVPTRLKVTVDNSYVRDCIRLIHKNISQAVTLSWLAKELSLSPSYLSSLFKHKTGRSITEYVRLVRLEKVKELIGEGRYTIAQIADIMGYCSPTYLSTEFKREYDMCPKEYAKML